MSFSYYVKEKMLDAEISVGLAEFLTAVSDNTRWLDAVVIWRLVNDVSWHDAFRQASFILGLRDTRLNWYHEYLPEIKSLLCSFIEGGGFFDLKENLW